MADYSALLNLIDTTITTNGQGDITGAILNNTLKAIVNALGAGYQFMGVATPATNPGTPDQKVFYLATTAGAYTNFNNITLTHGLWVLRFDTTWHYDNIMFLDHELSASSTNPVENATIKAAIDGLAELIQGMTDTPLPVVNVSGYYISAAGAKNSFSGANYTQPVHVKTGDIVRVTGKANENVAMISLTDETGRSYTPVVLGTGSSSSFPLQTVEYTAQNEGYLAFSALQGQITATITNYYIASILNQLNECLTRLSTVEREIYGERAFVPLTVVNLSGYYFSAAGVKMSFGQAYYTEPIQVHAGDIVQVTAKANENVAIICTTNATGSSYTPVVIGTGSTSSFPLQTVEYTVQNDGYLAFSSLVGQVSAMINEVVYPGLIRDVAQLNNDVDNIDNSLLLYHSFNLLSAFTKLVCIGDSLTYSQVYTSASAQRQAYNPYPKVISLLSGNQYSIIAQPGYTAKQIWDNFGSDIVSENNPLAIVYLGTNAGITDTLDTDVVGDNPNNWADNNVGCYCRIVNKLKGLGYKILLIKCWVTSGTGSSDLSHTNAAIQHIAERFNCAYIDCPVNRDEVYHNYPDLSGYNGAHYNDLGYAWFASEVINAVAHMSNDLIKYIIPA